MEKIRKILYVGSGEDTGPIIDFENATEFIYVDIMPRNVDSDSIPYNDKYCHGFIDKITDEFDYLDFHLTETRVLDSTYHEKVLSHEQKRRGVPKYFNPTVLIFENEEKTRKIKYYVSTNIEYNMCDELSEDIASSDSVAVVGYSPKTLIFDYFKDKKTFIAYSGTCYSYYGKNDDLIGACFECNNDDEVYKKYFNDIGYFLESHEPSSVDFTDLRSVTSREDLGFSMPLRGSEKPPEYSSRLCIEFPQTFNGTNELSNISAGINYRLYGTSDSDEDYDSE